MIYPGDNRLSTTVPLVEITREAQQPGCPGGPIDRHRMAPVDAKGIELPADLQGASLVPAGAVRRVH
jgi:hypothetical protein